MGDNASEMKVVEFKDYIQLSDHMGKRFPHLNDIWLSTEMQALGGLKIVLFIFRKSLTNQDRTPIGKFNAQM
ncbi:unnamed protein product [Ilex paraguariensis]|uniref:Uncharacterized protein n=1 Tax=Ilex paraguariensis TaxID=185542 RepID=A0ABC8SJZ8_9AQUA